MSEQEQWRPVPEFPDYAASNLGQIASVKGGKFRVLAGGKTEMGYRNVLLYQNGERVGRRVHQLVALTFHGPRPEGLEIRHLDGNKLNNAAANLAYGTAEENYWDRKLHSGSLLVVTRISMPRVRRQSTHCNHGHERTEASTYVYPNGSEVCRPCKARIESESRTRRAFRAAGIAA